MRNKIKTFLNLSLAVLFFSLYSFASAQVNVTALAKKITPSIVAITTYDGQGKALSQGNGFFINPPGNVITNVHILRNARRAEVKTSDGKVYPVTGVTAVDKKNDLVLVSVNLPQQKVAPLSLSSSVPKAGEKIAVVFQKGVSDGSVSGIEDISGIGAILHITVPPNPSLSGSPVVTIKGEVIGITTLRTIKGQTHTIVIPSARITNLASRKPAAIPAAGQGKPLVTVSPGEDPFVSGMKFFKAAQFEQARPYFEKAAKQNPKKSEAYFYIGLCYSNRGRNQEAIESYRKAISLKPDYVDAHNNLGVSYASLGRYNDAAEAYKQAIRLQPNNAPTYLNLGIAQGRLGRHQEAMEAFKKAISLKPDYPVAHFNLGLAYSNLGRYNEAIKSYKKAISLKPDYAFAHLNLGIAYVSLGKKDSAREEYKILKTLNPQQADELLKAINKVK